MGTMLVRALFVVLCGALGYFAEPWEIGPNNGLVIGLALSAATIAVEVKLCSLPSNVLVGGLLGGALGLLFALGLGLLARLIQISDGGRTVLQIIALLIFSYLGVIVGAKKGEWITAGAIKSWFGDRGESRWYKLLDTSVIIDGRIAEVAEAGFIDGVLVVPHFVIGELQQVADSTDALKRNRGRRGLDILQRLQKMPGLTLQVSETDFPEIPEVDLKLVQLAKELDAKVVTNDFNLQKVARVRGVETLNVNELAQALKPAYLPGERMSVYIVKEGKEAGQGVGYLDDGTMVVVDDARDDRGDTIELQVKSVLQTSAGKMIFGRKTEVIQVPSLAHAAER